MRSGAEGEAGARRRRAPFQLHERLPRVPAVPASVHAFRALRVRPSRTQTMFFGRLVHATLEDLHHRMIATRKAKKEAVNQREARRELGNAHDRRRALPDGGLRGELRATARGERQVAGSVHQGVRAPAGAALLPTPARARRPGRGDGGAACAPRADEPRRPPVHARRRRRHRRGRHFDGHVRPEDVPRRRRRARSRRAALPPAQRLRAHLEGAARSAARQGRGDRHAPDEAALPRAARRGAREASRPRWRPGTRCSRCPSTATSSPR